ncbi:MAG: MFS transporter [Bacteroidota bacterium]
MENTKTNYGALTTLITVFFFWGFIAAGNSIFIPFCKTYFKLDQFQSLLIDFAFYFAYYIGALVLFIVGTQRGTDPVGKWGYKNSIVYGLVFSALGAAAMITSVYLDVFVGMLFGLFIVALGFSLQQTAANPFMISLGDEKTGSNRISLGGGINSLGTTIAPLIVGFALFGSVVVTDDMKKGLSTDKVSILYVCVGLLFLSVAALFYFSKKLPQAKTIEKTEKANKALASLLIMTGLLIICFTPVFNSYRSREAKEIVKLEEQKSAYIKENNVEQVKHFEDEQTIELDTEIHVLKKPLERERMLWLSGGLIVVIGSILSSFGFARKTKKGWGAMQYPQLVLGMLAIFVYVGVEVAIGSNLSELLSQKEFGDHTSIETAPYIGLFWGSLMIGRWASAIHAFELSKATKNLLTVLIPIAAFGIVLGFSALMGHEVKDLYFYIICVLILIAGFFFTQNKPAKTLFVFSILGVAATLTGVLSTGLVSVYAFLSAGLFCSIMWPCIFSLSLAGLGKYKSQGSAFLVMMILGGAIIPLIQGKLVDITGVQKSFLVGTACFVYLMLFAFWVNRILKKQGVSLD